MFLLQNLFFLINFAFAFLWLKVLVLREKLYFLLRLSKLQIQELLFWLAFLFPVFLILAYIFHKERQTLLKMVFHLNIELHFLLALFLLLAVLLPFLLLHLLLLS